MYTELPPTDQEGDRHGHRRQAPGSRASPASRTAHPVSSWHVETGPDSTDDPAVWVWAMLKDEDVEFAKRSRLRSIIRDLVEEKTESFMLVYVRFRGASEVEHSA